MEWGRVRSVHCFYRPHKTAFGLDALLWERPVFYAFSVALYDTPAEYPFFVLYMGAVCLTITEHRS